MPRRPVVSRRVLTLGLLGIVFVALVSLVQVASAELVSAPDNQTLPVVSPTPVVPPPPPPPPPPPSTPVPTPVPTATLVPQPGVTPSPVPTPPPGVTPTATAVPAAPPTTVPYDWSSATTVEVPLQQVQNAPKVAVEIPAQSMSVGGFPASGQVTIRPVAARAAPVVTEQTVPDAPTLVFSGRSVEINVYGQTAVTAAQDVTSQVRFNPPLELSFDITDDEWNTAQGDISRFQVRFYSVQLGRWVQVTTEIDPFPPRRAHATVTHLTSFGLFLEKPVVQATETPVPGTPGGGPSAPGGGDFTLSSSALLLLGALGLALIAAGAYYVKGSRHIG